MEGESFTAIRGVFVCVCVCVTFSSTHQLSSQLYTMLAAFLLFRRGTHTHLPQALCPCFQCSPLFSVLYILLLK